MPIVFNPLFFFFLSFRSFWDIQFDSIFLSIWGHFCHIFVAQRLFLREQRENDWTFTTLYKTLSKKIIKLIRYFKNYWIWTKIKPRQLPYLGKVQKCIQGVSAWTLLMGKWPGGGVRKCTSMSSAVGLPERASALDSGLAEDDNHYLTLKNKLVIKDFLKQRCQLLKVWKKLENI